MGSFVRRRKSGVLGRYTLTRMVSCRNMHTKASERLGRYLTLKVIIQRYIKTGRTRPVPRKYWHLDRL